MLLPVIITIGLFFLFAFSPYTTLFLGTPIAKTGVFLFLLGLVWIALIIMEYLFRPRWQAKQQILKRHLTPGKAMVLLVLACLITGSFFFVLVDPLILESRSIQAVVILTWFSLICLPIIFQIHWRRMTKQEPLTREWTVWHTIDLVFAALLISGGLCVWITFDNSGESFISSSSLLIVGSYVVASVIVRFLYPLTFDSTPIIIRAIQKFVFNLLERLGAG